tara:strand:- start:328 stop:651 length:324 start_codon:yes stop_codon:yes gene_type:complete
MLLHKPMKKPFLVADNFSFFSCLWNVIFRSSIVSFAASPLVMPKKPKYIAFISQITFSRFVKLLEMMPASTSREAQIVWQESYSFAHAKQLQNMLFALYLIFSSLVG